MLLDWMLKGLPLYFASTGTTIGGDGGGAADAGGGGEGGGAEGGGDADQGVTQDEGITGDESGGDETTTGDEAGGETDTGDEGTDGDRIGRSRDDRGLPQHVKQALAKLREIDPKMADTVRRNYYEASDYRQAFPTVREAREARDLLEEVGGADGIQRVRGEADDYAHELNAMANGDPSVIEELVRDFPDGLVRLVPHALDAMSEVDPAAFEKLSAGIVTQVLANKGVTHNVLRLTELIADGKQKEAFDLAKQMLDWVNGVKDYADQKADLNARGGETDREKRVRMREQELEANNKRTFGVQVGGEAIRMLNTMIDQALAPMLKGRRLSLNPDQRKDFQNGARTEISNALARLPGYRDRMQELIDAGDQQAILRFIRSKVQSAQLVRRAVTNAWGRRGFSQARGASRNGSGTTTGVVRLAQKPSADQIDWSKDRSRMRYMTGEATLKNGKVARWDPSKV
jgi:hypothetical protein